ncbi:MAG: citrate synthase [Planctomycetota bacterium]|nr:MAG: citrate synthase [Planctomycetota bacterium]
MSTAKLILDGKEYELPVIEGTEGEKAIDIRQLRSTTGAITLDSGFANTGACTSAITYIDGERGILRYRGYPIEQLAEQATFPEVAYLLIHGELPTMEQLAQFRRELTYHSMLHEDLKKFFEGYHPTAHPMAILSAMVAAMSTYYPDEADDMVNMVRLLAKVKTIAAYAYKKSIGQPFMYPRNDLSYCANFLYMMFAVPAEDYEPDPLMVSTLNTLLILHADHEQNCSTSTVRIVGSSMADLYQSVSAGICALSGPLHGGANQRVLEMLQQIHDDGGNLQKYIDLAKDKNSGFRLMGFGHRVYKNYDPRALILRKKADELLGKLGINDPLLELAKKLEERALSDEYFVERNLYPNVDFYSGILYRAMGIPVNMFTVMFAIGRLPGWLAHWKELREDPGFRIYRPRQVYTGPAERQFVPIERRG